MSLTCWTMEKLHALHYTRSPALIKILVLVLILGSNNMPFLYAITICYVMAVVANRVVGNIEGNDRNSTTEALRTCQELNYEHQQQCHITNPQTWTCLISKALSINTSSCSTYRQQGSKSYMCGYSEICAFADDMFSCDGSYNCSVLEYGQLSCTKDQMTFFNRSCTPSLLYCTYDADSYYTLDQCNSEESHVHEFRDECIKQYEGNSTNHSLWFYVQLSHFNNESVRYTTLKSVHNPNWKGDDSKLCTSELEPDLTGQDQTLTISLASVGGIFLLAITYALYEGRKRWKVRQKSLRNEVEDFVARNLKKFVDSDENPAFYEAPVPDERCDVLSEIESITDLQVDHYSQNGDKPPSTEAPLATECNTSTSTLTHNWDNPSYISKKEQQRHNEFTTTYPNYFPKTEAVWTDTNIRLSTKPIGLLENSSEKVSISKDTCYNFDEQDNDLDRNVDDSIPCRNDGSYISKKLPLRDQ